MPLLTPIHVFDKKTKHDRRMPSLARRVINVTASAPAIVASGFAKTPDKEIEHRKDVCENKCPLKLWDPTAYNGAGTCLHKNVDAT